MTGRFLQDIHRALIGFDDFLSTPMTGYPPYNVIRTELGFQIDLAVAGFKKENIKVYHDNNALVVEGRKADNSEVNYLVHSLATRQFKRSFALGPQLKVTTVTLEDGILSITLHQVPQTTPLTYEIN